MQREIIAGGILLVGVIVLLAVVPQDTETLQIRGESGEAVNGTAYISGSPVGSIEEGNIALSSSQLNEASEIVIEQDNRRFAHNITVPLNGTNESRLTLSSSNIESHHLMFYMNDSSPPIAGDVWLDDTYLGYAEDGELAVGINRIDPGNIRLNGSANGSEFDFGFTVEEDDLGHHQIRFRISEGSWREELWTPQSLDRTVIRDHLLSLINYVRVHEELPSTIPESPPEDQSGEEGFSRFEIGDINLNENLTAAATERSEEMVESGYFAHTSPEGRDVYDVLDSRQLFYVTAGENLYKSGALESSTTEADLAMKTISGWMDSPGHRSIVVDRDRLYSDAGIGIECDQEECYVTLIVAGMEKVVQRFMDEDYCSYDYVYDPAFGTSYEVPAELRIQSTGSLDVYLASSQDAFDDCTDGDSIPAVTERQNVERTTIRETVEPGYTMVLNTNSQSNISMMFDYYPD